jgi:hypothetical protein
MGAEALIAALVGIAGTLGAFLEGRRRGRSQNITDDVSTVTLLQAAVAELERQAKVKDVLISDLTARIGTLESLVTQRADVAAVEAEVKEMRIIVDRIAEAVNA